MSLTLDEVYTDVCARLERGESVQLGLMAELQAYGYVFPNPQEDYEMSDLSPVEVTVSFADYTHDTVVEMMVDVDGDFWLKTADQDADDAILLSRFGAERLHELLGTALGL